MTRRVDTRWPPERDRFVAPLVARCPDHQVAAVASNDSEVRFACGCRHRKAGGALIKRSELR